MILLYILLIPLGLLALIKGAQLVVESSVYIARKTGLPRFVIGVTVVAFGTSLPELFVNTLSSFAGSDGLVLGNILGSNISNVLLVIGIAAIVKPISVQHLVATRDIPFSLASIFIFVLLLFDQVFNGADADLLARGDGLIMLMVFLIFLYYVAFSHKEHYDELEEELGHKRFVNQIAIGSFGVLLLILGGQFVVEGSTAIAEMFGISEKIIGLTIISISTSLPEMVTTIVAIRQGEGELGIGNIIGSNIFNLLFVLGISALVNPVGTAEGVGLDVFMMFIATVLLIISLFMGQRNKVDRSEGIFLS
ncbi:MAG: Inner membrane protein YrbG [candidate division WS6 bacterium OLB20]|uniref:Inner membrane protein YrbG n=1 Tax=candidate division WS6 bacterium OLB20 TaxID=1617426 RepID=A0A136LZ60_9BACT|nr:MAG: Inner membrane protein YrbG [candidate division WS6 bacterium OLB20]